MIVECQYCATRFQLDEGRIPPTGIRARCSQCKQAFFLEHPDASRDDAVDAIVSATLDAPAQGIPEPAADLPSTEVGPIGEEGEPDAALEEEDDFDWEFNLDSPGTGEATDEAAEPVPERSAFGPSGLELAGDSAEALPSAVEAVPGVPASEQASDRPTAGDRRGVVASQPARAEPVSSVPALPPAVSTLGWVAVAGLFALAVVRGLAGPGESSATAAAVAAGSFRVESVETQWQPVAGHETLLVVRGLLHNPTARAQRLERALTVVWLDASGAPLDAPAVVAGRPLNEGVLPTLDPTARERARRAATVALSREPVPSGERVPFAAYIGSVPAGASRVAIRPGPFPGVASPPRASGT